MRHKAKAKCIYFLSLVIVLTMANEKFLDYEQLQKHHNHSFQRDGSNEQKLVQVHLIPHSHDDVGWLKTMDEYYYGQHDEIQVAGVQYIIDSYVSALLQDSTKKFIQVETAFFKKWWDDQNEELQDKVKGLVRNGQLEFASGGWCMNDEATTYYEDIIDQMTLGHKQQFVRNKYIFRFLYDTFGVVPNFGWQIDPFGHSSTQALLSYQMGFNGWFFPRIDYQEKEMRLESKAMEMILRPWTQSGISYPIFAHINYYNYDAPPNFNFDSVRFSEPIIDNKESNDYNLKNRAEQFVYYFRNQSLHYQGDVLMHTMGEDFEWSNAAVFYKNLDKLMNYINERKDLYQMEIIYSTPSQYLQALNTQQLTFPSKTDDFFPYADKPHAYWTGYFTSRVPIKLLVKQTGRYAQLYRKVTSSLLINSQSVYLKQNKDKLDKSLQALDEALAICQHHDAVAGTEKQHVNDDYISIISAALFQTNQVLDSVVLELIYRNVDPKPELFHCNFNETASTCEIVYNSLLNGNGVQINVINNNLQFMQTLRVKVPSVSVRILDQENHVLYGDIICANKDQQDCDLFFAYQPKQIIQYFVLLPSTDSTAQIIQGKYDTTQNPNALNLTSDSLISINGASPFKLNYGYYQAYQEEGQKSGAYIFRPHLQQSKAYSYGAIQYSQLYEGSHIQLIKIESTYTETTIRKFSHLENTYEIETFVKSIPVEDKIGKEIVLLIDTSINNQDIFYTDSNGLELQQRKLNYRPSWDLEVLEPAAGNYYPINSMILIQDEVTKDAAVLLNDRSQVGGTSLRNGQIEVMIHRRLLFDDQRGVSEPLNELNADGTGLTQYVTHTLCFFNRQQQPNHHRKLQFLQDLAPLTSYSQYQAFNGPPIAEAYPNHIEKQIQVDNEALTKVFLQQWNGNTYLMRIHNLKEVGNQPIEFPPSVSVVETTLTGNQKWSDWETNKLQWSSTDSSSEKQNLRLANQILPLEIKTYLITFNDQQE